MLYWSLLKGIRSWWCFKGTPQAVASPEFGYLHPTPALFPPLHAFFLILNKQLQHLLYGFPSLNLASYWCLCLFHPPHASFLASKSYPSFQAQLTKRSWKELFASLNSPCTFAVSLCATQAFWLALQVDVHLACFFRPTASSLKAEPPESPFST